MNDSSDTDEDDVLLSESESEDGQALFSSPTKRKGIRAKDETRHRGIIVETAFDAYFTQAASRAQSSANVFSSLVPALSAEEYAEATASLGEPLFKSDLILSESTRGAVFRRMMLELREGFNVLCYGYGSKRRILNDFAVEHCAKAGHVVVGNGFQPDFSVRELLNGIENVPGVSEMQLASGSVENQARRIHDFFSATTNTRHLYLIIHNIDSPTLRATKAKSILSMLALNPRIHIVASVDHINAPLIWSSSEISARKSTAPGTAPSRGFAWLWHDMTTLAPYDFELAHVDRSSISGAHGGGTSKQRDKGGAHTAQNATVMSETAALHILASVTQKAKKLFVLMGDKQLEGVEEAGESLTNPNDMQQFAVGYDQVYATAREQFLATNDTALRSLLGEFRDHGLVLAAQEGGSRGEALWIPLPKERLLNVLRKVRPEITS